jgi:hypothetical protein
LQVLVSQLENKNAEYTKLLSRKASTNELETTASDTGAVLVSARSALDKLSVTLTPSLTTVGSTKLTGPRLKKTPAKDNT